VQGNNLHIKQFAEYAAGIIAYVNCEEGVDARTSALDATTVEDSYMNGLTEDALTDYLSEALVQGQLSEGFVTEQKLVDVLTHIPKIQLSEREAVTIVAGVHQTEEVRDYVCLSVCVCLSVRRSVHSVVCRNGTYTQPHASH
jgi:hypothetical protein